MSFNAGNTNIGRDISFYYYSVGSQKTPYDNAPYPSGLATGYIPYNTGVFYAYEGNIGAWPGFLYGQNSYNTYLLATYAATGSFGADGLIIVDRYGGVEPFLTGVHLPAIVSGINGTFAGTQSTYTGLVIIDIETYYPIWIAANTGNSLTYEYAWRNYYNSKYGYNDSAASGVWFSMCNRMYDATIDKFKEIFPMAKVAWYGFPNTQITLMSSPSVLQETTGSVRAKNDLNNNLFSKLDFFACELYNSMGKPVKPSDFIAGTNSVYSYDLFNGFNNTCAEINRIANNNNKNWIAILQPVYPPGPALLSNLPVGSWDHDIIVQAALINGVSGLTHWMSLSTAGAVATGAIGLSRINQIYRSVSERFVNLQNPLTKSNLWDTWT